MYHVKMPNSPSERITMEKITNKPTESVSLKVSKSLLVQLKKKAGIVGSSSPTAIVKAYIQTTLNSM